MDPVLASPFVANVKRGEVVGKVGRVAGAPSCHLHFEIPKGNLTE
jgi:murein DD-endopeptidase MepM/ murein hydrolase activator NlpD